MSKDLKSGNVKKRGAQAARQWLLRADSGEKVRLAGYDFDYGVDKVRNGQDSDFYGIAFAHHYAFNNWFSLSPRFEVYKDAKGFITGTAQTLKEFTMTAECKLAEGFLARMEYRRDWSDKSFFDRGNELAAARSQSTLLIGFVAYFGPKR